MQQRFVPRLILKMGVLENLLELRGILEIIGPAGDDYLCPIFRKAANLLKNLIFDIKIDLFATSS